MNPASMFMDDSMMDFGALPDLLLSEDLLQVNNDVPIVAEDAANNVFACDEPLKHEFDFTQEIKSETAAINIKPVAVNNVEGASVLATYTFDELVANNDDAQAMEFLNDVVDANLASPATSTQSANSMEEVDVSNLIDEMEDFLSGQEDEGSAPSPVASSTFVEEMEQYLTEEENALATNNSSNLVEVTDEHRSEAENILDALMKGNVAASNCSGFDQDSGLGQSLSETAGINMENISNISEIVTEDGKKIVIVITNDVAASTAGNNSNNVVVRPEPAVSPASTQGSMSPYHPASPGNSVQDESDGEWCPPSQKILTRKVATKRKAANTKADTLAAGEPSKKRGPYKRNGALTIKDKKERKKLQNVEAARRYRDKKKVEQNVIETEEEMLVRTNNELKSKFSEMENEVKTLKKLMAELGLIK